jgi:hypothetical protein
VADKFHVLRLLNPALIQRRKEITGDRRSLAIRRLLLRNGHTLDFWQRLDVQRFLSSTLLFVSSISRRKPSIASIEPVASIARPQPSKCCSSASRPPSSQSSRGSAGPSSDGATRSSPTSTPASPTPSPKAST